MYLRDSHFFYNQAPYCTKSYQGEFSLSLLSVIPNRLDLTRYFCFQVDCSSCEDQFEPIWEFRTRTKMAAPETQSFRVN